jgi:hypothetical protein
MNNFFVLINFLTSKSCHILIVGLSMSLMIQTKSNFKNERLIESQFFKIWFIKAFSCEPFEILNIIDQSVQNIKISKYQNIKISKYQNIKIIFAFTFKLFIFKIWSILVSKKYKSFFKSTKKFYFHHFIIRNLIKSKIFLMKNIKNHLKNIKFKILWQWTIS